MGCRRIARYSAAATETLDRTAIATVAATRGLGQHTRGYRDKAVRTFSLGCRGVAKNSREP